MCTAGTVTVDAGVSLDTLMRELLPHGLWLPVLPGTRQVTVGGAIGSDIHGKAHHVEGSFGNHVLSLDLATADGEIRTLTPDGPDSELFWATVGGMGLTGVVLGATLHVNHVETAYFLVDTEQIGNLDDLMARQSVRDEDYVESVSWFDAVTTGRHLGRGILTRANHARVEDLPAARRADPLKFDAPRLLTVPDVFPPGMLNRVTAKVFAELWYRKSPTRAGAVQNITQFLHPLDLAGEWNRVYGPRGFLQYQFVVPFGAEDAIREAVAMIAGSGHVSALNVLKRFGAGNRAPLSFPTPGWTLCVDFPVRSGLHELCQRLDEVVLAAGGRLYLAKESRTTPGHAAAHVPEDRRVAEDPCRRRPEGCLLLRHVPKAGPVIDAVGNPQSLLLLGGTSEIGLAVAQAFARSRPLRVVLAGRPGPRLDEAADRLRATGSTVAVLPFDARRPQTHAEVVEKAFADGDIDVALVAFGMLGDQEAAWTDVEAARETGRGELRGRGDHRCRAGRTVPRAGPRLAGRAVVGGRRAGAAVELRLRLDQGGPGQLLHRTHRGAAARRRAVSVIRPGFVHSRMTEGMKAAPLSQTPDQVAAIDRGRRAQPQGSRHGRPARCAGSWSCCGTCPGRCSAGCRSSRRAPATGSASGPARRSTVN